jgi:uncharacterized protein YlxW (UPF0749 family)
MPAPGEAQDGGRRTKARRSKVSRPLVSRMATKTTLQSLASLLSKASLSADKKFTALAEDNAAIEKRLDARLDKLDSGMSNLSRKIEHLGTKLTKFEESEIDKRKQLEVRVAAIEKHLGIDRKIPA